MIKCKIERITPERALKIVESKKYHFGLHVTSDVDYLAAEMKAQNWLLNGETIKFDADGFLVDGIRRVYACMESKTPFWTLVAYGVDKLTFATVNAGKSRSLADSLHIDGIEQAQAVAVVVKYIYRYKYGNILDNLKIKNDIYYNYYQNTLNQRKLNAAFNVFKSIHKQSKAMGLNNGIFLYYVLGERQPQDAKDFFEGLLLDKQVHCRETLQAARKKMTFTDGQTIIKIPFRQLIKLVFHTWNLWYSKQKVKNIDIPRELETPYGLK